MRESDCRTQLNREADYELGNIVKTRYKLPPGYHRVSTEKGSFEDYLQTLPLKSEGYVTHLYDGSEKENKIATSVIDMDIDSINFHNDAVAVIRLRSEYLYHTGQYDKINFKFKDGFHCSYTKWAQGFRVRTEGEQSRWSKEKEGSDYSYDTFREYLRTVFLNVDEFSLASEMRDAKEEEFGIGTVIFNSQPPYNSAIVVDMLKRDTVSYGVDYGYDVVLIAQGGNPTQEIEIVQGNGDELNLFKEDKKKMFFGYIFTTPNKGEKPLHSQGGKIFSGDKEYINKKLKNF
ncbi:MAG: DUF4846 domain-containing protein [Muribaculaceae bacterium]|nr:DUF4846 domain-containing protein [Muribaculaceae bacterium]MDE6753809.1 DUF4846 domain-containing protein [Muribaculaceae bacterium]